MSPAPSLSAIQCARSRGNPTSGSDPGPDVSYNRTGASPPLNATSVNGTRTPARAPSTYTLLLPFMLSPQ
nr:hypothetical protein GCM10025732_54880 [Glycomyces mayteni]